MIQTITVDRTEIQIFICDSCHKQFRKLFWLNKHIKRNHEDMIYRYD